MKWLPPGSRRERAFVVAAGTLIHLVLRLLRLSCRLHFHGDGELRTRMANREPLILAFWHGRLAMVPFLYTGRGCCIMNSAHRDGMIISQAIRPFGIGVVHGSSTRGWVGGLKGLLGAHRSGRDLVVVPDGPKGPRCRAKSGVIQLARATGAPIFPLAWGARRAHWLRRSWDWLSLPLPGTAVHYVVEPSLAVARDASAADQEAALLELERRLNRATTHADAHAGVAPADTRAFLTGGDVPAHT